MAGTLVVLVPALDLLQGGPPLCRGHTVYAKTAASVMCSPMSHDREISHSVKFGII